jgi:hypothetical protein
VLQVAGIIDRKAIRQFAKIADPAGDRSSSGARVQQYAKALRGRPYVSRDGIIDHVSAIGTGGMRCYTDASSRPGFSGSANIR